MEECNNQPKVGIGKGLVGGEMVRWEITKGWDVFPLFGGQTRERKTEIERAMGPAVKMAANQLKMQLPTKRWCRWWGGGLETRHNCGGTYGANNSTLFEAENQMTKNE
jgi:hypothetical protein